MRKIAKKKKSNFRNTINHLHGASYAQNMVYILLRSTFGYLPRYKMEDGMPTTAERVHDESITAAFTYLGINERRADHGLWHGRGTAQ